MAGCGVDVGDSSEMLLTDAKFDDGDLAAFFFRRWRSVNDSRFDLDLLTGLVRRTYMTSIPWSSMRVRLWLTSDDAGARGFGILRRAKTRCKGESRD